MLIQLAAAILHTNNYKHAGEWAEVNRILPLGEAEPGPFKISRTPYFIPVYEAAASGHYKRIVVECASQMGKTDLCLNLVGYRMDTKPAPTLFVEPDEALATSISRGRFEKLLLGCANLQLKRTQGREPIQEKYIAGVPVRFVWSSSAKKLCSHPVCLVILDERDRMDDNVEGEGDPVELAESRTTTYPDALTVIVSTPTIEEASPIDSLFKEGTARIWQVSCPFCREYFAPELKFLKWELSGKTVQRAWLACSHCWGEINDSYRQSMNASGRYTSDTQIGNTCASFRISGLCSPWRSYVQAAQRFVDAQESHEQARIQTVVNTVFGETWKVRGDAPKWQEVYNLKQDYVGIPHGEIQVLSAGVDVQQGCLYYAVRAWGFQSESWTVDFGVLYGDTEQSEVWQELETKILRREYVYQDKKYFIRLMAVDSGYRAPNVYLFCKRVGNAVPAKGKDYCATPVHAAKIDVDWRGRPIEGGVLLYIIDDGYFKSLVHARVKRGNHDGPGCWHLPTMLTEDFCQQIVAEELVQKATGKLAWIRQQRDNHYLDCEKLNEACGVILNVDKIVAQQSAQRVVRSKGVL